jgi:hypothetical protein
MYFHIEYLSFSSIDNERETLHCSAFNGFKIAFNEKYIKTINIVIETMNTILFVGEKNGKYPNCRNNK